ncbi:hypothetical protein DFH94DRAFT_746856 [Russula ochroleuca]|uniref:non-specific serine/threonine protein kinase n=1 Tax=Russula ochroleuca TaxID=152965 RepID=A0A9P5T823_9AGAM|nr:hypothetical protein DFH94DRAFT_746856 [Russula ochroleuca]
MSNTIYNLWCYLEGDNTVLPVDTPSTISIGELKKMIKENYGDDLKDNAARLSLSRVNIDYFAVTDELNRGEYRPNVNDEQPLQNIMSPISDVWPEPPPDGHIHVFIRPPPPTVLGKRTREVGDVLNSKIYTTSPSQMGKLREYKSLQQDQNKRILDDRPVPDSVPPASLLYDGFGHFMDIFRHRKDVYDLSLKRRNLELAVDNFAELMTDFHDNEDGRKMKGLLALNEILSNNSNKLAAASIDSTSIHSDGHYNGPHDAVSCIVGFKNELVDISSMPLVELIGYVAHSHAQSMARHEELYKGWRVPCLGMTIVGPYVTFYAVIFLRKLRVVSLTPALSCVASAGEGDDRKALYAAFSGALDLLRRIDEDAKNFLSKPPKIQHLDYSFPYISALPKFDGSSEKVHFQILRHHPDVQSYRLLYIAETSDKKQILVKFTPRYSIALHAFCADRGHAPVIHGFQTLPGGWFVVAMDYISPISPAHLSRSPDLTRLLDKWTADLQKLMQSFHDEGLVHGDLREPNILCDGEKVMLIDFDWGGEVGKACYPRARLCHDLMEGRDNTSPEITKGDDRRVLQNTLGELKNIQ